MDEAWEQSLLADVEAIRSGRMRTISHEEVRAEFGSEDAPSDGPDNTH